MPPIIKPIHEMSLNEARRSLLDQLCELRTLEEEIPPRRHLSSMSEHEVERITDELIARNENIQLTVDRIDRIR